MTGHYPAGGTHPTAHDSDITGGQAICSTVSRGRWLLAAVEMDDTGTTRIGKYVFNHSFLLPGLLNITIAVALGFLFGSLIL